MPMNRQNANLRHPGRHTGFTLIEIMVVVVILGILGALIVPNVISRPDQARVIAARSDIRQLAGALKQYRLDNGFYPTSAQGLEALVAPPSSHPAPARYAPDGYLARLPLDPWDRPYYYLREGGTFEVYSYGADGREGGEGHDGDIFLSNL